MKIWLASYPRSGNTYTRTLLNRLYGLHHASLYDETSKNSLPDKNQPFRSGSPPDHKNLNTNQPTFIKTHELPCDDIPAIYLVRDGRDALVSYAWYIVQFVNKEQSDYQTTLKNLILDPGYFGGWGAHVLAWKHRSAPTAVIKFEEIVTTPTPRQTLEKAFYTIHFNAFEKIEKPYLPSFKKLHELWPEFFRKGKIGSWKEEMPPDLNDLFWKHHGKAMKEMGYTYE